MKDNATKRTLRAGTALCLSGGGYRAMLYHVGALRRLAEFGLLPTLSRISSVSGGSVAAGVLALSWNGLAFDGSGVPANFESFEKTLFDLAGKTIDVTGALRGIARSGSAGKGVASIYKRLLFDDSTLQDLPDTPRFVFNTTNMRNGSLFRWSKPYGADFRLGRIARPQLSLAVVVAASSAFPPFLSPLRIATPGIILDNETLAPLSNPPPDLWLADGGVYDNLGLQTAESFSTVLASDGGSPLDLSKRLRMNWLSQSLRTTVVIDAQVRRQRRRGLVRELQSGYRNGALWTINTDVNRYTAQRMLRCPTGQTSSLAGVKTRLAAMPVTLRYQLMNWGYASADASIRSYVDKGLSPPSTFPYPGGVG